jgi:hypothetical protein
MAVWSRLAAALGALLFGLFAAAPAQAKWLRAESPHFVVYSDGGEADLRAYVLQLEGFDWVLRHAHGVKDDGVSARKLDVYLVGDHGGLERVWPKASSTVRGFYRAGAADIAFFAIRHDKEFSISGSKAEEKWTENPVFHEYVHHFMLQYFPFDYPPWLTEGYAEYFGTTSIEGAHIELGKFAVIRTWSLFHEPWQPMELLLARNPKHTGRSGENFYPQAWLLTHWMMSDPARQKQLHAYMLAVGRGDDTVKAMQDATGLSPAELAKTLRAYLNGDLHYTALERRAADGPAVTVTALPASADELLLEAERGRVPIAKADAAAFLAMIRAKAARFPADRLAEVTLARTEIMFGDRKAGEAILERRLSADPTDVEALELAASARLDEGDADPARAKALAQEAQPLIGRAFKLDPNRYQTLWTFARSRKLLDASYPSDNTLEALLAALDYGPQVEDIRLEAARGMMLRKRWRDAGAILAPLLNAPHENAYGEQARAMMKEIQAQTGAAAPAAVSGR